MLPGGRTKTVQEAEGLDPTSHLCCSHRLWQKEGHSSPTGEPRVRAEETKTTSREERPSRESDGHGRRVCEGNCSISVY